MAVTTLYIGTYTDGQSRGIYRVAFDARTGALSSPTLVATLANPTCLAWHPEQPRLYAVSEISTFGLDETGAVVAFMVGDDGRLQSMTETSSGGAGPCYVSVTRSGAHVLVANYSGGSVAVLPVTSAGGLREPVCVVRHAGAGPHPTRQPGPRAHAIAPSPGGRFIVAADLGADRLVVYRLDPATGALADVPGRMVAAAPGAGPRHFAWHPRGDVLYVVNELDSTVAAYHWDETDGALTLCGTAGTLPVGWSGENTAAHVAVHPSARALYVSNRGHDSIAHCTLDQAGAISAVTTYSSGGRTPRHFALDTGGRYLVVANQESDTLVVFATDEETGVPVQTRGVTEVPSPAFVLPSPA